MKIRENVPIAEITTMRLGGDTRFLIDVEKVEEVREAYKLAADRGLPVFILGKGANSIGRDEGFKGVIIRNRMRGIGILESDEKNETLVKAMGGEQWDDLVEFTTERNLTGIEAMSAIPGTVGAAPVQNIGAYGQDISQVLEAVEVYDSATDEYLTLEIEDLEMGYRKTVFNTGSKKGHYFIIAIILRLRTGQIKPPFYTSLQAFVDENQVTDFSPANIRRIVTEIRDNKLPNPEQLASAGSFFKNIYLDQAAAEEAEDDGILVWKKPGGQYMINTGWLLEEAGLKGQEFHGMVVSDKAALVLINRAAQGYADLAAARAEIRKIIREKFGFELEQEPVEIAV